MTISNAFISGSYMSPVPREKRLTRAEEVLVKHSLKKTPLRRSILIAFFEAKGPLSQADLIDIVSREHQGSVDRVSIYRNLRHLTEVGVLHGVDSNNYVLCCHECEEHGHLLLFCQKCRKYEEIKDHKCISEMMLTLRAFHFFDERQPVFLRGICTHCAQ